jgi:hypothetical protein
LEEALSEYRLYMINAFGHVRSRFVLRCNSDVEAIALVERHRGDQQMELWQDERLVCAFAAEAELMEA